MCGLLSQYVLARPDFCSLPPEKGPCKGYMPSFYYDTSSNTCKQFFYGGCAGNSNRFPDREKCEDVCQ
ncbi:hypothetical protein Btru_050300 [Bulinus truncatus]|nr:hypothetical protein Btru_050300 [Bulinus truncatus]